VRNLLRATLPVTLSTPSARPPTRLEVEPGTRFVRRALFEFDRLLFRPHLRGPAAAPPPAPRRSAPRPCVPSSIHQMRRSVLLNTYLRLCYSSCVWRGIHHLHCTWSRFVALYVAWPVCRRVKLDLTCAWLPFKTCRPCMLCRPTRGRAGRAGRFEGVARSKGRTRTGGHKG
jgi:hypothetical protein